MCFSIGDVVDSPTVRILAFYIKVVTESTSHFLNDVVVGQGNRPHSAPLRLQRYISAESRTSSSII